VCNARADNVRDICKVARPLEPVDTDANACLCTKHHLQYRAARDGAKHTRSTPKKLAAASESTRMCECDGDTEPVCCACGVRSPLITTALVGAEVRTTIESTYTPPPATDAPCCEHICLFCSAKHTKQLKADARRAAKQLAMGNDAAADVKLCFVTGAQVKSKHATMLWTPKTISYFKFRRSMFHLCWDTLSPALFATYTEMALLVGIELLVKKSALVTLFSLSLKDATCALSIPEEAALHRDIVTKCMHVVQKEIMVAVGLRNPGGKSATSEPKCATWPLWQVCDDIVELEKEVEALKVKLGWSTNVELTTDSGGGVVTRAAAKAGQQSKKRSTFTCCRRN
jgi:hypothetical protein